jgi:putative salt-induced outer membrane protein
MLRIILPILILLTFANAAHAFSDDIKLGFQGESELGGTTTSGNTKTSSVAAKTDNKYLVGNELWTLTARYLRNADQNTETALFWSGSLRYDHELSDLVSVFLGYTVEADPYSGYVQRDSVDLGGKYYFMKRENFYWLGEAGYRYSKTHTYGENTYESFLRFYTEMQENIDKNTYAKVWIEYLPNLTNNKAYLTNAEASVSAVLTQLLSLKVSYLVKYQNQPTPGYERTDSIFLTTLVAKY